MGFKSTTTHTYIPLVLVICSLSHWWRTYFVYFFECIEGFVSYIFCWLVAVRATTTLPHAMFSVTYDMAWLNGRWDTRRTGRGLPLLTHTFTLFWRTIFCQVGECIPTVWPFCTADAVYEAYCNSTRYDLVCVLPRPSAFAMRTDIPPTFLPPNATYTRSCVFFSLLLSFFSLVVPVPFFCKYICCIFSTPNLCLS